MRVWHSVDEVPADLGRTVVVVGNFDGVHLGHQHVIARARELADAHTLAALEERFALVPIADVARRCFPTYTLTPEQSADVRVGRRLGVDLGASGPVALLDETGAFLALYEQRGDIAAAVAVFTS